VKRKEESKKYSDTRRGTTEKEIYITGKDKENDRRILNCYLQKFIL